MALPRASDSAIAVDGPVGQIEILVDKPVAGTAPKGFALIAHPHPLYGGTNENKVVQTLARAFVQLGYVCWRPNFRGVGASEGQYDEGLGETQDLLAVLAAAKTQLAPLGIDCSKPILAGFSFGSFVQCRVAAALDAGSSPNPGGSGHAQNYERLVLIGAATERFNLGPVRSDTLLIHGEKDEVIALASVLDWARPQSLPIVVVPGGDHFFNHKLVTLKQLILGAWGVRSILL